MTIISIALQKGGVGKSTTAQTLASTLNILGKRVLLIDMDTQANVTFTSTQDIPEKTLSDVLGEECTAKEAILHCSQYDLLAADSFLTNVEMSKDIDPRLLKKELRSIKSNYDFIIIDTPPALGNLSVNALVASDYVIIPTDPKPYALQGLSSLQKTIQMVQKGYNKKLKILGILLIKYTDRINLNSSVKEMLEDYAKNVGTKVFNIKIREGIAVAESQIMRKSLIEYAPKSKPAIDYMELTKEILTDIEGEK